MKRIIFLTCLGCLTLESCSDVLDTKPLDAYTADAVWGNYNLAEGFIFNCYSSCMPPLYEWQGDANTKSVKNHPWGGAYTNEKTEQITRDTDEGWGQFDKIRMVNQVLANVKKSPFSPEQKNKLIGEAHFLRAAVYSSLAFKFGGVQLVKNVLTIDSDFKIPRASLKETYDFVLADLDTAANLLPRASERGRAAKGAAYALQMRVALQAGAYINDNAYYTKVKSAGDLLFTLGYSLDNYANMFTSYSSAVFSPENILVFERRSVNTGFSDTPMQSLGCNSDNAPSKLTEAARAAFPLNESIEGWMGFAPTQDLVDDYLVTDADGKEKKWDQTSYFANGNNVYKKMYRNRDLRFYASIIYDSCKYFKNTAYLRADGNVSSNIPPLNGGNTNGGGSQTGYLFAKYMYQQVKLWYSTPVDFCYSVLRLGEAYLNYAEAALLLGEEGIARDYISRTYKKHGGFANNITASGQDLWTAYKRERHVEMILETGDRYRSLLRWGMQDTHGLREGYENTGSAIPELNGKIRSMAISADGNTYQIFETGDQAGDLRFTPKRYLYPVPFSKIQANPLLKQNAGW